MIEYYPYVGSFERTAVRVSRVYKFLKFVYLSTYNRIHYGRIIRSHNIPEQDFPPAARISAYINDQDPDAHLPRFFERDFVRFKFTEEGEVTEDFLLRENYESLARSIKADRGEFILTTQYQNLSNSAESKYINEITVLQVRNNRRNDLIREISARNNLTLVDLDRDMAPYGNQLLDEVHWDEDGIRMKGELIGQSIWSIMKERYNITEGD